MLGVASVRLGIAEESKMLCLAKDCCGAADAKCFAAVGIADPKDCCGAADAKRNTYSFLTGYKLIKPKLRIILNWVLSYSKNTFLLS